MKKGIKMSIDLKTCHGDMSMPWTRRRDMSIVIFVLVIR